MRWYDIVSGTLPILFIIDFALAAPVLVQEKRQACVYAVHIPRDVTTELGKRAGEELEKLAEQYLEKERPAPESSDVHESPGTAPSAPPAPDHVSTNVVQAPALNSPVSSTTVSSPMMELSTPSWPSPTSSTESEDYGWLFETESDDASHKPLYPLPLSWYNPGLDHGLTGADAPQPNPNLNPKKRPLTEPDGPETPDPDFPWDFWMNVVNKSPLRPAKLPKLSDQANAYQAEHVQHPDPPTLGRPLTDSYFGFNQPPSSVPIPEVPEHLLPSTSAWFPTEPKHDVSNPSSPKLEPPIHPEYEVLNRPPPSPETPELGRTDSQPVDLLTAINALKNKGKESRRTFGLTRDVGNGESGE